MEISNVAVFGAGTLGTQITFQIAFHGFRVNVCDVNKEALRQVDDRFSELGEIYRAFFDVSKNKIESTLHRIEATTHIGKAVENADLISEAIPENLEIKTEFYQKLAPAVPDKTIITTNTSTLTPSQLVKHTGHPRHFLAMHFANKIWERNLVEIMGHPDTDSQIFERVVAFAGEIGMVPLPIYKEQQGYILNTLLIPMLSAAGTLLVNEVAKAQDIDRAWMIGTGAPMGPFAFLDMVGMKTVYNVTQMMIAANPEDNLLKEKAKFYKENFIDKGKLGVSTGEGFYSYPNPKFKESDFLKK